MRTYTSKILLYLNVGETSKFIITTIIQAQDIVMNHDHSSCESYSEDVCVENRVICV